ncbi:hypothetical protein PFISCL1PPCAC_24497, partial [Pristionchus fissidentatus]
QMPFILTNLRDTRYRCCFREVHAKVGVLVILSLNAFTFTMLLVQTALSSERSRFDLCFLIVQGVVIISTVLALFSDTRWFLYTPILFWMGLALSTLVVILLAILYAIYPNDFPARFNFLLNHRVLDEQNGVDPDKITMVRGVAITGIFMLCILFIVFIWFVGIHRKCYRYMREVTSGRLIPTSDNLQGRQRDISDLTDY